MDESTYAGIVERLRNQHRYDVERIELTLQPAE
jgi:hypothetical protein